MTVDLQRRRVFQSAVAGGALSLGAFVPTPVSAAVARATADIEVMTWSGCAVNCGSRCQLRVFSKNGRVIRIETDASGDASASTIDAAARRSALVSAADPCASASMRPSASSSR